MIPSQRSSIELVTYNVIVPGDLIVAGINNTIRFLISINKEGQQNGWVETIYLTYLIDGEFIKTAVNRNWLCIRLI